MSSRPSRNARPRFWSGYAFGPFGAVYAAVFLVLLKLAGRIFGFDAFALSPPIFVLVVGLPIAALSIAVSPAVERLFGLDGDGHRDWRKRLRYGICGFVVGMAAIFAFLAL